MAYILAQKVMQSLLPSSLHCIVSLLIAPAQTDRERSLNEVANMGWLQLINDALYVIVSTVFQCMEYR
jgi:hypothetical protein